MPEIEPSVAEKALKSAKPEIEKESAVSEHESAHVFSLYQDTGDAVARNGFFWTQRLLALGAIFIVLLSVFETYSNQPESMPAVVQEPFDAVATHDSSDIMSLRGTVDLFETRRIFGPPPVAEVIDDEELVPVRGWRAELRDHWNLMGTSEVSDAAEGVILEAIVRDGRAQSLQFLHAGAMVRIADQNVEVTRVEQDRVEFRRGDEVFVLD